MLKYFTMQTGEAWYDIPALIFEISHGGTRRPICPFIRQVHVRVLVEQS